MTRTFQAGDHIPADVTVIQTATGEIIPRYNEHGFGETAAWGTNNTGPDSPGAWEMQDFPLTELIGGL